MKRKTRRENEDAVHESHFFKDVREVSEIRDGLLKWYDSNQRSLPWRSKTRSDSGYRIWVSEVMLQQTRVSTVIDYFKKWMTRWPTISDLARAELNDVNSVWSGLGYYSRAKRLWEGAIKVENELDGVIPKTSEVLMKELPGVGKYTARAIASIAYQEPVGVVDGNVVRVFSRMRLIGCDSGSKTAMDAFWENTDRLVDPNRSGDFNQALMELGARICTPKSPSCSSCPVSKQCLAYKKLSIDMEDLFKCDKDCPLCLKDAFIVENGVTNFPRKGKKSKIREETLIVVILRTNCGKYVLFQRPEEGLLANLLEFLSFAPSEVGVDGSDLSRFIKDKLGLKSKPYNLLDLGSVDHVFSHIKHTYRVWSCRINGKELKFKECLQYQSMVLLEDIAGSPISTAMKKVFKLSTSKKIHQDKKKQTSIDGFLMKKQNL